MPLETLKVDPAGNITLLVLDPVDSFHRSHTAAILMRRDPSVEQVGFVIPPFRGGDGRVEMMGGEFCGNAARSLGFYLAQQAFSSGCHTIRIEVSGAVNPIAVIADLDAGTASAQMPLPRSVTRFALEGIEGGLVVFDGISHLVLPCPYSEGVLLAAKARLQKRGEEAYGVLFLEKGTLQMTPVVTVRATDTTVFEGSCGSGSVAVGCLLGLGQGDGEHCFMIRQPKGTIESKVSVKNGQIISAAIGGSVVIDTLKKVF